MNRINLLFCALFLFGTISTNANGHNNTGKERNNGRVTNSSTSCTLTASASVTNNVTCNGGNDGGVSVTPSSGTSPYTYMWGDGNTNSTETGLTADTYSVTVTDNDGCTATASATITEPTAISVSAGTSSNVTCNAGNDGSVSSTPSNGTAPYTYSWTGGGTNSTETGLSAGTYIISVTDNCGATTTASTTITQPSALSVSAGVSSNVTCNGGSDGSVSSTPSNGTEPYTYSWTGGGTNTTEMGISAGTYTITVTDNCGGTATASATITQPTTISVSVSATYSLICLGKHDTLATMVSGGNAPYTYSWSPTGGPGPAGALSCYTCQNPIATPLTSTTFTLTVTDNSGCNATSTVSIMVDIPSVSATSSSNLICPGANTTLNASVEGGTSPYTYSWFPPTWLSCPPMGACSSPTAYPPVTINYNVFVTDANGCSNHSSVTVNVDNMSVLTQITPPFACIGSGVVLHSMVQGGQHPFTYLWSPGSVTKATDTILTPVSSTTYSIVVSDSIGCSASTTAVVSPDNFSASLPNRTTICAISATGEGTGGLSPLIAGGVAPFTYSWSNGNTSSYLAYAGLTSGIYSVTVTDGDGCTTTARDTLTVNPVPTITIISSKNPIQIGWVDTLNVTGGIGYTWSDGSTTTQIIVRPRISTEYSVVGWNSYSCYSGVSTTVIVSRDYWMPSPDTTIPHLKNFPPIYFAGNISVGKDSGASAHHALEVHGSAVIDSTLTVGGLVTNKITVNDTLVVPVIRAHRLALFPGDSIIHFGDSSIAFNMATNNIYGTKGSIYTGVSLGCDNNVMVNSSFAGQTPEAVGCLNTLNTSQTIAIGYYNTVSTYGSMAFGEGLVNSKPGALMFGNNYWTGLPAITILPDNTTNHTTGFVGIGTTTPNSQLNIMIPSSTSGSAFSVSNSTGSNLFYIDQNGNTLWGANEGSNMLDADQGGSMELGAYGNSNISAIINPYNGGNGGKPYIDFHYGNGIAQDFNVRIINSSNGQMDFDTYNSTTNVEKTVMSVISNSSGENYVRTLEVRVCLTSCDFVFDKDYKLMPLKDLEAYLNINHHLPGIQSAAEMESEDGVALGKLTSQLLLKVEELTLYNIQLKKELDELKKEVAEMHK